VTFALEPDYCLPTDYMLRLLARHYDGFLRDDLGLDPDEVRRHETYGKAPDHRTQERVCAAVVDAYVQDVMRMRVCSLDLDNNVLEVCGHTAPSDSDVRGLLRHLGVEEEEIVDVQMSVSVGPW
jgi:hypothetical protein